MAGSRFLLDTNIVVAFLNAEAAVRANAKDKGRFRIPSIVVGELCFGAENSDRPEENVRRIARFAAGVGVIPCDAGTGTVYGRVKRGLHREGTPIPENDIWIAATALQHDLVLVSRDAHFRHVDGLTVVAW